MRLPDRWQDKCGCWSVICVALLVCVGCLMLAAAR